MHPVWKKVADLVEKDFDRVAKREAHTVRIIGLVILLAMGLAIAGAGYMLTHYPMEGSYCEYPDPYGR